LLVVAKVWLEAASHHLIGEEVMEHQHICLLDHLCVAGSLGSEEQVGGNRTSRGRLGDDHGSS